MKKKSILIFFAIALLAACKTNSSIKVGVLSCYKMDNSEKDIKVDKASLHLYNSELLIKDCESFINKLTVSSKGKMYFGFVLAELPPMLIRKIKADSAITIVEEKNIAANETTFYFYKVKKKSGLLLVKAHFQQPKLTNSIMVDAVFENETDLNEFYNHAEDFTKKFICDDEKNKKQ